MSTFVLLHGSWHAAWNWHRVIPLLEAAGHQAVALDLPAHGRDRTPARDVSLARCVDAVVSELDRLGEPAVLVAHSRNGMVISEVAERRPEQVAGLVYLAAYLVPDGRSMMDYALLDGGSLVARNVETVLPRRLLPALARWLRSPILRWLSARILPAPLQTHRLAPSVYREALYHDCPDEITALAEVLLEAEPNWPGFTPLRLTDARYGRVPRVYMECTLDRAVTLELQRRMIADSPCDRVVSLESSHSPFFSQPAVLVARLIESLDTFALAAGRGATPGDAHGPRV
jgi:pimeloyl-ACP methyl ester carboxylesterase